MVSQRALLACAAAGAMLCITSPALAQTRTFNVPAQPAFKALPEFARQARMQIIAPGRDLAGIQTPAVVGELDVRLALARLLEGTPLEVARDNGQVIVLRSTARGSRGQAGRGAISGAVIDPATGEYLRDATIRMVTSNGEHRAAASGERGEFRLTDVPAGEARVTVSFTGYPDSSVSVTVEAGKSLQLDLRLSRSGVDDATKLGEVVIIASQRDGDARAIMSQRQSMDIKNSLSSESFGDIAEGNVGEFIKLMPGVDTNGEGDDTVRYVRLRGLPSEYTSVTVNGVSMAAADANDGSTTSRSFSFEQVSLSSIDSIEISKTISADVDANAPAGAINLRTKRAFDRKGRRVSAQLNAFTHSDLWNDRETGPDEGRRGGKFLPSGQIEYSDVFFNRRLGVVASVSQSRTYTEMEQTYYPRSYVPTAVSPEPMAPNTIYAHMRGQEVSRFASSLTLDFKATDRLILSLAGIYNQSYLWSGQRTWIFTTDARTRGVIGDAMTDFTTKKAASATAITAQNNAISKEGKGKTFIPSFEYQGDHFGLDGNLSYSDSTSTYDPLGKEGSIFNLVTSPTATGNFAVKRSGLMAQDWRITQIDGPDWNDPASFKAANITLNTQDGRSARTELVGGALNLTVPVKIRSTQLTIKTGLKAKRAVYDFKNERSAHQYRYTGPLTVAQFLADTSSINELSFNDLGVKVASISGDSALYTPSNIKMGQFFLAHPDQFTQALTADNYYTAFIANTRHFEEDTNAAYLMATAEITDRITGRLGLRWEETETRAREFDPLTAAAVKAAGYAVSASTGRATTIDGLKYQYESRPRIDREGSYDYFFPSASLKVAINDSTDFQLGYSRTIRRPEVNVLAGVWSVNDDLQIVTAPNPGLKPELSDNISVRIAHYFEPIGLVAINYYRNKVKGLFQTEDLTAEEFGYAGTDYANYMFRTTRTAGGDAININGFEIEFNHALAYLPGVLSGLSVKGSYTQTNPEAPIALSARHFGSLALAYKKGPLSFNLNTVMTGRKLNSVSTGSFIEPRTDMSFSGAYAVRQNVRLFLSMRNLLNENTNIILPGVDTPNGPIGDHAGDYRAYGRSATLGLRLTF
jgi:TonB-dependent receptor